MAEMAKEIRRVMVAANKLDGIYYEESKRAGINMSAMSLLYALSDGNAYSQTQISREWLIPKTTISTVVRELAEKGYITLEPRRNKEKFLRLTPAGASFAKGALARVKEMEHRAMTAALQEYPAGFVDGLERFVSALEDQQ